MPKTAEEYEAEIAELRGSLKATEKQIESVTGELNNAVSTNEKLVAENAGYAQKERSELEEEYNNAFPETKPEELKELNNSLIRAELKAYNKTKKRYEAIVKKDEAKEENKEINNSTNGGRTVPRGQTTSQKAGDPIVTRINNRLDGFGGHN